jgi:acetolactate synthase-1/2/3 large subunit
MEVDKVIAPEIHPAEGPLLMGEVVNAVSEATGNDAVLVTDVGQNQMMGSRYFHFRHSRSMVTSGGLGTMGFGLPAAIGAAFGAPERTVCAFVGDGGLQMSIQEFGTIMDHHVPVKLILHNNNYQGNVRQWQDMFFGGRKSFTRMHNADYVKVAQAYDIQGETVVDRADLPAAIDRMLHIDGPYLLQCAIKETENIMPMTPPGASIDEMMLEWNGNK